jgi:tRNA(Ile)-lysidine synthase
VRRPADDAPFGDEEIERRFAGVATNYDEAPGALLAVSGGSDSLALLLLARRWRDARGAAAPPLVAATIDHGLRSGASDDAAAVAAVAARWGFEHVTLAWEGPKPATGVQEAAREARYGLLLAEAERRGFANIAVAHTLDDQAETVLMRLIAGSGLKGLAGMSRASYRGRVLVHRPLLDVPRARLRHALAEAGVSWLDDPSNADPRFLRPRLRELLPLLAAEGLDAARLDLLARKFGRADRALHRAMVNLFTRAGVVEDVANGVVVRLDARLHAEDVPDPRARPAPPPDGVARRVTLEAEPFFAEAQELQLRAVSRALAIVRPTATPPEQEALERLCAEIGEVGLGWRGSVRRTLAGCVVSAGPRRIRIAAEPPRRARP